MNDAERRVPIGEVTDLIQAGVALPFNVYDALDRLLLSTGQVVYSDRQVEALIERGAWVERALVVEHRKRLQAAAEVPAPSAARKVSLFTRWERLAWDLDAALRRAAKGAGSLTEITACVETLLQLVERDVDVAIFLAVRQEDRRFALYPLHHVLHSAVLALAGARQAQWPATRQRSLAGAALTMNVAILELQAVMAEQDTPPTQRQLDQIRAHPGRSVELLRAAGIDDEAWLQAVADHHERADGSGYPRGLKEVPEEARMLRMADVYMSKITPRAKRPPIAPQMASRQLFQQEGSSPLAMALIKAIGVHPPGALVQLKSGEVAVVTRRGSAGPAPQVCTLSDRKGQPSIASTTFDSHDAEHAITGPLLDTTKFQRVLAERVYGVIEG